MGIKVVVGGIIEKNGKFLLIREKQKICNGKWNIPAGALDEGENLIEGARREIYEEAGLEVEITGIIDIVNKNMENNDLVCFFFDTKIIKENIKEEDEEVSDVEWFTYDQLLTMKDELRVNGYFLESLIRKLEGKITSLDVISV